MLLMRSLTQRQAGKVVDSSIRYADVNPVNTSGTGSMPLWLQTTLKKSSFSVETPATKDLGIQAGVYGALMVLTYVSGASTSSAAPYAGADVPGLILASSFGASLYFMTKKNVKLGNELTLIEIFLYVFILFLKQCALKKFEHFPLLTFSVDGALCPLQNFSVHVSLNLGGIAFS